MSLTFRPVRLGANSADQDARLVFDGDELVAIVSHLSRLHGEDEGKWWLEVGFGDLDDRKAPPMTTLDDVREWIVKTQRNGTAAR